MCVVAAFSTSTMQAFFEPEIGLERSWKVILKEDQQVGFCEMFEPLKNHFLKELTLSFLMGRNFVRC